MTDSDPQPTEPIEPSPTPTPAPTSQDVARLAQVSRATVSYVLNDTPNARVSAATRARVRAAAAQLGYVPHEMASSLRAGRTDLVLLPFFDWPYNQSSIGFLQSLTLQVDSLGYTVMLRLFRQTGKAATIRKIASFHPVGMIVPADAFSPEDVEILSRNGVRTILAYGYGETPLASIPSVTIDFTPIGAIAAEHLAAQGHRRLAAIVPRDPRIMQIGRQRYEGVARVAAARGLELERVDLDFDLHQAAALAARWRQGPSPTAVFTYNDEYALLLMRALHDAGLSVPHDVALMGCDNLAVGELVSPRLSSIALDSSAHVAQIATHFDALLQGRASLAPLEIPTRCGLVVRETS